MKPFAYLHTVVEHSGSGSDLNHPIFEHGDLVNNLLFLLCLGFSLDIEDKRCKDVQKMPSFENRQET